MKYTLAHWASVKASVRTETYCVSVNKNTKKTIKIRTINCFSMGWFKKPLNLNKNFLNISFTKRHFYLMQNFNQWTFYSHCKFLRFRQVHNYLHQCIPAACGYNYLTSLTLFE